MKLEMRVTSATENATPSLPRTYNFVLAADPDSVANKAQFGDYGANAQFIVNGAIKLPAGFGQKITVQIGDETAPPATQQAAPQQPGQRVPGRMRAQ